MSNVYHAQACSHASVHSRKSVGQVLMKEAEPGLGISRLAAPDFARLMRVARFFTAYARAKQVSVCNCVYV